MFYGLQNSQQCYYWHCLRLSLSFKSDRLGNVFIDNNQLIQELALEPVYFQCVAYCTSYGFMKFIQRLAMH